MAASIWGAGGTVLANQSGTIVPQSFIGTAGQTLFTLTNFIYTPGTNSLVVYINGSRQSSRDFTETSTSSFTLNQPVIAGDFVDVVGVPAFTPTAVTSGSVVYTPGYVGGVQLSQQQKNDLTISTRTFGCAMDGITDDSVRFQVAVNICNLLGLELTVDGAAMLLTQTITFGSYFNIDWKQCQVSCQQGAGIPAFSLIGSNCISWKGGNFTGNGTNNWMMTKGTPAAQAILKASGVPPQALWANQIRISGSAVSGFNYAIDLQNFSREIWLDKLYVVNNFRALNIYGKVLVSATGCEFYSGLANSQCVVTRGDTSDPSSWRYAEGLQFTDCLAQSVATPLDIQSGFVFFWRGQQVICSTPGVPGISITPGLNGANPKFIVKDIDVVTTFNSPVSIGSGLAAQWTFNAKFGGCWTDIPGTAVIVNSYCVSVTVEGSFDGGVSTPLACSVGANCAGIVFRPGALGSSYTASLANLFQVDTTSVTGTRAWFTVPFTTGLTIGGTLAGITQVCTGRISWFGSMIEMSFDTALSVKGAGVGSVGFLLPYPSNVAGSGTLADWSGFNTAIVPTLTVPAGSSIALLKNCIAGGTPVQFTNADVSNATVSRGTVRYHVS